MCNCLFFFNKSTLWLLQKICCHLDLFFFCCYTSARHDFSYKHYNWNMKNMAKKQDKNPPYKEPTKGSATEAKTRLLELQLKTCLIVIYLITIIHNKYPLDEMFQHWKCIYIFIQMNSNQLYRVPLCASPCHFTFCIWVFIYAYFYLFAHLTHIL